MLLGNSLFKKKNNYRKISNMLLRLVMRILVISEKLGEEFGECFFRKIRIGLG